MLTLPPDRILGPVQVPDAFQTWFILTLQSLKEMIS